ncbi:MAG: hypothetical protein JKY29_06430 [Gammaproteobacteria bacterium]|nr:hypothetical protein [Gammaproteobacteria bacterium]
MASSRWTIALVSKYTEYLCVFLAVFLFNYSVDASETDTLTETNPWQWLERGRSQISQNVTALGRNLDAWLSGESIGENSNETYLRIRLNQQVGSFDSYHSRIRIDGSLDLPQTSKRWKLIFESDAAELNSLEGSVLRNDASTESIGGLSYQQSTNGSWQVSHSIGFRSRVPADPFYRLKTQYEHQINDDWSLGYRQKIWHYRSQGWGYNTDASFNRKISQDKILQISSEVRYQQEREQIEFSQTIALHSTLKEFETMSWELGVLGINTPSVRIDDYYIGAQYRRAIRGQWLFLEVRPQLVVSRDENWRAQPKLMINLEMLFFDL